MFLNQLEESEKIPFYSLALNFALVDDGQIDENEKPVLLAMQAELGINITESINHSSLNEAGVIFKTPKSRKIVLVELLGVAYTHGVVDSKQRDFLLELSRLFEIEMVEFEHLEKWVVEMLHLTATGYQIINS